MPIDSKHKETYKFEYLMKQHGLQNITIAQQFDYQYHRFRFKTSFLNPPGDKATIHFNDLVHLNKQIKELKIKNLLLQDN